MLKIGAGYDSCTHNLVRLLRYAGIVSYELPDVFVAKESKEQPLMKLLQRAYSDARYSADYCITPDQVLLLQEKVRRMLEIFSNFGQTLCCNSTKENG